MSIERLWRQSWNLIWSFKALPSYKPFLNCYLFQNFYLLNTC